MRTIEQLTKISIGRPTMLGSHYEFIGDKLQNVCLNEYETEVHQIIRSISQTMSREEILKLLQKVADLYMDNLAIELCEEE